MFALKQPLSYEEQVQCLIRHNLLVENHAEALAVLKKINYYRLSAYGIGLKTTNNKERYIDGISFNSIYRLYSFDSHLRNILMHIIEQIEIQLRTQIAHLLALKYGAIGYMEESNFVQKTNRDGENIHTSIIQKFETECSKQKEIPFVKHHIEKYKKQFPIWVAVELFSFGNLSQLCGVMKPDDRIALAKLYNTKPCHLSGWIPALVEIRNICAHNGRIYNLPLKQAPFLYEEYKKYRSESINKLFPVLITIMRMLNKDDRWRSFADGLKDLMDEYSDVIQMSFMGFPVEWESVLIK